MERNWMEVFPWARWGGNDNLPPFAVDQTFMPTELLLKEVRAAAGAPPASSLGRARNSPCMSWGGPAHQLGH